MNISREEHLKHILSDAMVCFKNRMNFDISFDNTVLAFFTPENGLKVYEDFCDRYFPDWTHDDYKSEGYFEEFAASAFVGEKYGILIRSDLDETDFDWFRIFLHEISHIYCVVNEIGGEIFFDKYCRVEQGIDIGVINAGYQIWREAIADIMAQIVNPDAGKHKLKTVSKDIKAFYNEIAFKNPASRKAMSLIIAYIKSTEEVRRAKSWDAVVDRVKDTIGIKDDLIYSILELTYRILDKDEYWRINLDFIISLGEMYLMILTNKKLNRVIFTDDGIQ